MNDDTGSKFREERNEKKPETRKEISEGVMGGQKKRTTNPGKD